MQFHRRTIEQFTSGLVLDHERSEATAKAAAAQGVQLPASVIEWYGVDPESELWRCYRNGHPVTWIDEPDPSWDDYWWRNPKLCRDHSGWYDDPILPIRSEEQGTCLWGVVLDGSDDPAVVISDHHMGTIWEPHARTFSEWVYAEVFYGRLFNATGLGQSIRIDEYFRPEHLEALVSLFEFGPTTRRGERLTFRFQTDGVGIVIECDFGQKATFWYLWADTPEHYMAIVTQLAAIQKDARYLWPPKWGQGAKEFQLPPDEFPF